MRQPRHQSAFATPVCAEGFSLIELMVVLSIAALLLTVAVPSMASFFTENRLTSSAGALVTATNVARSEAVKRGPGKRVTLKPNNGSDWATGWTVFVDTSSDPSTVTVPSMNSTDTLAYFAPVPSAMTVTDTATTPLTYISFVASGEAQTKDGDFITMSLQFALNGKSRCVNIQPARAETTNGTCS
jgi:type IV fimbrial biogenesis protein FimT